MSLFMLNMVLAITWGMATGVFTVANLAVGFALGFVILRFARPVLGPATYYRKVPLAIRFTVRYIWDLFLANFRVAYDVLMPGTLAASRKANVASRQRVATVPPSRHPVLSDVENLRAPLAAESYISPGVLAIPLDARTDAEIALLANLITLTPGSVSLDVSEDRSLLYIHAMYIDGGDVESYRRDVKENLERRVLELLR